MKPLIFNGSLAAVVLAGAHDSVLHLLRAAIGFALHAPTVKELGFGVISLGLEERYASVNTPSSMIDRLALIRNKQTTEKRPSRRAPTVCSRHLCTFKQRSPELVLPGNAKCTKPWFVVCCLVNSCMK